MEWLELWVVGWFFTFLGGGLVFVVELVVTLSGCCGGGWFLEEGVGWGMGCLGCGFGWEARVWSFLGCFFA